MVAIPAAQPKPAARFYEKSCADKKPIPSEMKAPRQRRTHRKRAYSHCILRFQEAWRPPSPRNMLEMGRISDKRDQDRSIRSIRREIDRIAKITGGVSRPSMGAKLKSRLIRSEREISVALKYRSSPQGAITASQPKYQVAVDRLERQSARAGSNDERLPSTSPDCPRP